MRTLLYNGKLILPDRVLSGSIAVENGKIVQIGDGSPDGQFDRRVDLAGNYLSPGFVELHTHGAGGADYMDGTEESYRTACLAHLEHGTTTVLPTLLAASREEIRRSLTAFRRAKAELEAAGMTLPGVHLEGPYLNRDQCGAINPVYIRDPEPGEYEPLLEDFGTEIRRWTAAVEQKGALELGDCLARRGILASIGHSNAVYDEVAEAIRHGYTHVTHLYSSMSTIVRRGGFRYSGVIESAFCLPELTVEIIADGCHLPAEILHMVYRSMGVERVALTCDSMRCAGQDVKESFLGSRESGQRVIIEDGVAKLPDRTAFAGSIATDDRLVRVMYRKAGVPLHDAVQMMTLTPARIIGLDGCKGSLDIGKDADMVCFNEDIRVCGVMAGGKGRTGCMV